jgi:hypothetical protein
VISHAIRLFHNEQGQYVDAVLHERIDATYAEQVDKSWQGFIGNQKARAAENGQSFPVMEHEHWEWNKKVSVSAHLLSCPTLAIECNGETQGLMLLQTDGFFFQGVEEKGKPLVYVTFLSSAPWNIATLVSQPIYKGVGSILLSAAIQMSDELGFKGRIGLHSLPQSESFYECHNLNCLGKDADKQDLKYYELSSNQAAGFLK